MFFIPRWERYSEKPSGPVEVDYGHELAKGLRNVLILNEAAELKTPGTRIIYDDGVAKFDGSTLYDVGVDLSWMEGVNEYSISGGITPSAITGNHAILALMGGTSWADTKNVIIWVDNEGYGSGRTNCISFHQPRIGTMRVETAENSVAPGRHTRFTCRQKGAASSGYINGRPSGNSIGNAQALSTLDYFKIGLAKYTIVDPFLGSIDYLYVHDRDLSEPEIAAIAENPYQILKARRRFWFVSSAAAMQLSGDAANDATATGALSVAIPLTASAAAAVALANGVLTAQINMSGAATAVADASGNLAAHVSTALSGQAAALVSAEADLTAQVDLGASAVAQALASGDLTMDDLFSDRLIEKYTLRPPERNYAINAPARNYTLQAVA